MAMQLLVDLAQTVKDLAEAHGLTSQALRSAQIAARATGALPEANGLTGPTGPTTQDGGLRANGSHGSHGTHGAHGSPKGERSSLHVSLQELYELKTLRVKMHEVEQDFKQQVQELQSQLVELRENLLGLSGAQETERKGASVFREETRRDLESLTGLSSAAKLSLEDHEDRLSAVVAAEQEARQTVKDGFQQLRDEVQLKLESLRGNHQEALSKHSLQLVEIRDSFTSFESEILEVCAKDRNTLQSKQQESLEQLAEVRHLSQKHYGELQEEFRNFQQLMLNKQWEAKQTADAALHDLRLRLDKIMWQRSEVGTAAPSEPVTLFQEGGSPAQQSPLQRPQQSPQSANLSAAAAQMALEEVRQNLEMRLAHVEDQLKRSIQRLSEDITQKQLFLEVSLEKTSSASQAEERLTNRVDECLRNIQFELTQELAARKSDHGVLGDLQGKVENLETMCRDLETSATHSRSTSKSLRLLEVTVQDMKVSIDRNQSDVQDIRGELSPLPPTVKRVDDLWRHFEGLRADVEHLERSSKADVIALGEHLEAKVGSIRPRQGATGGVGRPASASRPPPSAEPVTVGASGQRPRKPEGVCPFHWQRCVGERSQWP